MKKCKHYKNKGDSKSWLRLSVFRAKTAPHNKRFDKELVSGIIIP